MLALVSLDLAVKCVLSLLGNGSAIAPAWRINSKIKDLDGIAQHY